MQLKAAEHEDKRVTCAWRISARRFPLCGDSRAALLYCLPREPVSFIGQPEPSSASGLHALLLLQKQKSDQKIEVVRHSVSCGSRHLQALAWGAGWTTLGISFKHEADRYSSFTDEKEGAKIKKRGQGVCSAFHV